MQPIQDLLNPIEKRGVPTKRPKQLLVAGEAIQADDASVVIDNGEMSKAAEPPRKTSKKSFEILAQKTAAALQKRTNPEQQILQLDFPQWNEERRAVPNPLIRGGLFTTRMSAKRMSLKAERIVTLSNCVIVYTGEELRQDDLSVWMAIVNQGRSQPVGEPIYFTAYKLIKDMNWRMHVDSYSRVRACIDRLKVTSIKVTTKNDTSGYAGSLIRDFAFDGQDNTGRASWVVRLEPTIVSLFPFDNTTLLMWEQRRRIGTRASLTLWLHTFYSSHREPLPFSISKIHELSKSDEKRLTNFRARARLALETLIAVGLLASYTITNDIIYVKRERFLPRIEN